jgi:hypothetical protein
VVFQVGSLSFVRGWPQTSILLPMPPECWDHRHVPPYLWRWGFANFLPVPASNHDPPDFASRVAVIMAPHWPRWLLFYGGFFCVSPASLPGIKSQGFPSDLTSHFTQM